MPFQSRRVGAQLEKCLEMPSGDLDGHCNHVSSTEPRNHEEFSRSYRHTHSSHGDLPPHDSGKEHTLFQPHIQPPLIVGGTSSNFASTQNGGGQNTV